jgi:hypothetical protein
MGKLIDIFVEWARKEQRWPLLMLLLVPLFPKLTQEYLQLSFAQSLRHWSNLIASGIVLILSGGLYHHTRFGTDRGRMWVAASLAFVGLLLVTAGAVRLRPASLPSDRLVVAVARMTAVTDEAQHDADNFSHLLEQRLREKQRAGLPIEVKRVATGIEGAEERIRRALAVSVARSYEGAAHVVIWGDVRRDDGQLYVEPRLTVARPLGQALPEDRSIGGRTSEGPKHILFKEHLATEVTETVSFVYGLALFNAGRWYEAANVFGQSISPANRL